MEMKKGLAKSAFKKLNLSSPIRLEPVPNNTRTALGRMSNSFKEALKKGEKYRKEETKKFGGNPLPGELGAERYFNKAS